MTNEAIRQDVAAQRAKEINESLGEYRQVPVTELDFAKAADVEPSGKELSAIYQLAFQLTGNHIDGLREVWRHAFAAAPKPDDELERLRRFRTAVIGWRENDWPEGFCRRTAEQIAEMAKAREES
jgi:hypothetical protein